MNPPAVGSSSKNPIHGVSHATVRANTPPREHSPEPGLNPEPLIQPNTPPAHARPEYSAPNQGRLQAVATPSERQREPPLYQRAQAAQK